MHTKFLLISVACLLSACAGAHGRPLVEAQLGTASRSTESVHAGSGTSPVEATSTSVRPASLPPSEYRDREYLDAYSLLEAPHSEWKVPYPATVFSTEDARASR